MVKNNMINKDYKFKGAIFDLDGVIVDTAKYHYLAWKRLANELGFDFTEKDNERLKGVSRMRSLDILLEIGNLVLDDNMKQKLAEKKNSWYVEYLLEMDETEILPGSKELLINLRNKGIKTSLGSASKNAGLILDKLNIKGLFDAIVDGNLVSKAKPDPEVFLIGAEKICVSSCECVVFEDAKAGVEAAKAANMYAVGVGDKDNLPEADMWITNLGELNIADIW